MTRRVGRRVARAVAEAVAAERARVARELHDGVGHAVTVMVLYAAAAQRLLGPAPGPAGEALAGLQEQGRQAMAELRRVLQAPESAPGAAEIAGLVDSVRGAGVPVRMEVSGTPRQLPPGVGLAAYRVVQEALTNVGRHARPGAAACVRLAWTDKLRIEVRNEGRPGRRPAGPAVGAGRGLVGLRERLSLVGGRLEAGPAPGGGFRVAAVLPAGGDRWAAGTGVRG